MNGWMDGWVAGTGDKWKNELNQEKLDGCVGQMDKMALARSG